MNLLVDIGNTRSKWLLVNHGELLASGIMNGTDYDIIESDLEKFRVVVDAVFVSSVTGAKHNEEFTHWCTRYLSLSPVFASVKKHAAGLTVAYEEVFRLGVDRWLAMLAAWNHSHAACIVIDAGSAITVDYVDGRGCHQGGVIAPGVTLMREALFSKTSAVKLESVELPERWRPGIDTVGCVAGGLGAMICGFLQQVLAWPESRSAKVFLTGGDARLISIQIPNIEAEQREHLVLEGLIALS